MRIGFDAKRAAQNKTGLGNYSRFVLQALADAAPRNEYVLYIPDERKQGLLSSLRGDFVRRFPADGFWKKLRSLWRVWGVTSYIEADRVEVYHGLSNELPLNIRKAGGVKSVVTIHDLIFLRYPECYPLIDRIIYNYQFHCRERVYQTRHCAIVSHQSREDRRGVSRLRRAVQAPRFGRAEGRSKRNLFASGTLYIICGKHREAEKLDASGQGVASFG